MNYNKDDLLRKLEENKEKMLESEKKFYENLIKLYDEFPKYISKKDKNLN